MKIALSSAKIQRMLIFIYLTVTLAFAGNSWCIPVSAAILAIALGNVALRFVKRIGIVLGNKFSRWYIMFAFFSGLSLIWCYSAERVLSISIPFLTSVFLVIAVVPYLQTMKDVEYFLHIGMAAVLLMCIRALLAVRVVDFMSLRMIGTEILRIEKNYYSIFTVYFLLFALFFGYTKKKKAYFLYLIPTILVVFGAGSRKSILIMIFGILTMITLFSVKSVNKLIKLVTVIVLVLVPLAIIASNYLAADFERIINGISTFISSNETGSADASAGIRRALISRATRLFITHPFIGVGINNFSYFADDLNPYGGYIYAHNNYMEILSDLGIIGFILYYRIYRVQIKMIINKWHILSGNWKVFIIILLFSFLLNDIGGVTYYNNMYIYLFMLLFHIISRQNKVNN